MPKVVLATFPMWANPAPIAEAPMEHVVLLAFLSPHGATYGAVSETSPPGQAGWGVPALVVPVLHAGI